VIFRFDLKGGCKAILPWLESEELFASEGTRFRQDK
jgi:hypothetical protein